MSDTPNEGGAGGPFEPARKCGCCQAKYAPTLVKRYLGLLMCVECVRGFVAVFARGGLGPQ